jgi:hypothetical protein
MPGAKRAAACPRSCLPRNRGVKPEAGWVLERAVQMSALVPKCQFGRVH